MNYRLVTLVLIIACIGTLIAIYNSPESASLETQEPPSCTLPLTYRFGRIDQQYDISRDKLTSVMKKVNSVWSQPMNTEMLQYDPEGKIALNFVYSDMQRLTENEQVISKQLDTKKEQREAARQSFNRLKKQYEKKISGFKTLRTEYKKSVSEYNSVAKELADQQPLAPADKVKLKELKRSAEKIKIQKDRQYMEMESLRKRINAKANQLNALVDRENKLITDYNESFSGEKKFNQGHYIKQRGKEKINIYQFNTDQELQAVLAHEFGHALGLDHGSDPRSIMFYLMTEENKEDPALSEEDIAAIRDRCF